MDVFVDVLFPNCVPVTVLLEHADLLHLFGSFSCNYICTRCHSSIYKMCAV